MNEEEKGSFLENEDLAACIKAIKSLKGIEKFTALEAIDLDNGMPLLESLDVSGLADSLTHLQAAGLPKLNTLILGNNTNLQALYCYDDPLLCELDISGCTRLLKNEEGVEFEHDAALNIITDDDTRYAPKFYGKALMLSGNLGLYFYVKLPVPEGSTFDELYDGSYMTFAITEGTQETRDLGKTTFDEAETITITEYGEEVTLYGFRCEVTSAQIADKIAALFHYGTPDADNDNQMKYITLKPKEGETEGTVMVSEYLEALTAQDFSNNKKNIYGDETAELAKAIMDYGHYAQEVLKEQYAGTWNHAAVTPANNTLDTTANDVNQYALTETNNETGLSASYTLVLDSSTDLEVYLEPSTVKISGATIDGKECTFASNVNYKVGNDNRTGYRITLANIPAHELGEPHEVVVTAANENTFTISNLSAMSYVHKVLSNNESSEKMKNVAAAIRNYYNKTLAYVAYVKSLEGNTDPDEGN